AVDVAGAADRVLVVRASSAVGGPRKPTERRGAVTGNDDKRGVRGRHRGLLFGALSLSLLACTPNGGGDAGPDGGLRSPPVFPADFAETYTVARPCFLTHEHELRYVQVFADALAYPTYTEFEDPYPVGATIVKI